MGMKIDIVDYDSDTYALVQSEHEYIQHEITSTVTEDELRGWGEQPKMGVNRFYEDVETGIITRDVGRYEAFLRKVGAL